MIETTKKIISFEWLTGPIFGKELRISSRRKRNYILRTVYLLLMMLFVVLVWNATMVFSPGKAGDYTYIASRMAEAGKYIITTITIFQFCTMPILAIIMLCTSISDEIYNKTLGVLMTTPINSFQIVMGKLLSKILQIVLLLAISLPLMAVVRVFGGIPWIYLLSSLCLTLTTILFTGSLTILFSISGRKSYAVILKTIAVLAILFGFIPALIAVIARSILSDPDGPPQLFMACLYYTNPLFAMHINVINMLEVSFPFSGGLYWPVHCIIMLGMTLAVLAITVKRVRKTALAQITGQETGTTKKKKKNALLNDGAELDYSNATIRSVKGCPLVWKELRTPIIKGSRKTNIIALAITITVLLITYVINHVQDALDESIFQEFYINVFAIIGLVTSIALSATTITTEKESRSWPILLATTMTDRQIIIAKAIGVFRRCLPIWLLLFGHVILFIFIGYLNKASFIPIFLIITYLIIFFSGTGLYFSSRFKRTTTSVCANFGLAIILWLILPIIFTIIGEITHKQTRFSSFNNINPVVQISSIANGAGGSRHSMESFSRLRFNWSGGKKSYSDSLVFISTTAVCYSSIGIFLLWRAKARLRKNIFN
ncbi:MAG: ABC transporter permease subunit [Phycisphaerae bacterium]|nr:ABC transporter permease subunit [Phycisphaerae bacterium]